MAKSKGFTPEQKMEMRMAYEAGDTLIPLAKKWSVSAPTMADYIRHAGGKLRNRGTPQKAKPRQMFHDTSEDVVRFEQLGFDWPAEVKPVEPETTQAPVSRRILPFE